MKNDNEVGFICYFGDLSSEEVEVINDYWLVTDDGGVNGGFAYSVSRVSERHGLREGDIRVIIKKGSGFCAPGGVGLCGSCGDVVLLSSRMKYKEAADAGSECNTVNALMTEHHGTAPSVHSSFQWDI